MKKRKITRIFLIYVELYIDGVNRFAKTITENKSKIENEETAPSFAQYDNEDEA